MAAWLQKIAESRVFKTFIVLVILAGGTLVGLQTYPEIEQQYGLLLDQLERGILLIFVLELIIRIGAFGRQPLRFFRESWNVFDFVVVAVCLLPINGHYAIVLRLARIFRILRLISALPRLQLLVGALLKSVPSIGYIAGLLLLLFFIYACIGSMLFGANSPANFGNLHLSMLSLFTVVTLEDWVDLFNLQYFGSDVWAYPYPDSVARVPQARPLAAVLYFISFILIGTMIILNLFIGVIMNGMAEMEADLKGRKRSNECVAREESLAAAAADISAKCEALRQDLALLHYRLTEMEKAGGPEPDS